eukprot:g26154.t1
MASSYQHAFHSSEKVRQEFVGKSDGTPGTFFTKDEWQVISGLPEVALGAVPVTGNESSIAGSNGKGVEQDQQSDEGVVRLVDNEEAPSFDTSATVALGRRVGEGAGVVSRQSGERLVRGQPVRNSEAYEAVGRRDARGVPVRWTGNTIDTSNITDVRLVDNEEAPSFDTSATVALGRRVGEGAGVVSRQSGERLVRGQPVKNSEAYEAVDPWYPNKTLMGAEPTLTWITSYVREWKDKACETHRLPHYCQTPIDPAGDVASSTRTGS